MGGKRERVWERLEGGENGFFNVDKFQLSLNLSSKPYATSGRLLGRVGENGRKKRDNMGLGISNGREKGTGRGKIGRWGKRRDSLT